MSDTSYIYKERVESDDRYRETVWNYGMVAYTKNHKGHNTKGPAEERLFSGFNVTQPRYQWFVEGKFDRHPDSIGEDGEDHTVEYCTGRKEYRRGFYSNLTGYLHRENGPAVIHADGRKEYHIDGKRNRENGPAVTWPDGYGEYYIDGLLCKRPLGMKFAGFCKRLGKRITSPKKHQNNIDLKNQLNDIKDSFDNQMGKIMDAIFPSELYPYNWNNDVDNLAPCEIRRVFHTGTHLTLHADLCAMYKHLGPEGMIDIHEKFGGLNITLSFIYTNKSKSKNEAALDAIFKEIIDPVCDKINQPWYKKLQGLYKGLTGGVKTITGITKILS